MGLEISDPTRTAPPNLIRSPILRRTLLAGIVVVSLAVLVTYWDFTKPPYLTANDFSPDYVSAMEWASGGDPYGPLRALHEKHLGDDPFALQYAPDQANPHPPALIVLTTPLTPAGFRTARIIHMFLMLTAGGAAIWMFARRIGLAPSVAALAGFVVPALPVAEYDVRWGGASGLILLLLVWGWIELRAGREGRAGAILGAAAALKIFPWIMVIPLLRAGKRKAAGWFVGTAALVSIAAALAVGVGPTREFLTDAVQSNFREWRAAPHSVSLVSLPFRLFAGDSWFDASAPVSWHLSLLATCMLALCVLGALRTTARFSGDIFWATVPWMILASPIAWAHYFVVAVPLGILLLIQRRQMPRALRAIVIAALVILALGVTFVIWSSELFGFALTQGTQVAVMSVLVAATLFVAIVDIGPQRADASRALA